MTTTHLWQGTWHGRKPTGDSHIRSREVVRSTGDIARGKFPSRKNGRSVHYESLLELDAIYLFETSPNVVRYREQAQRICYPDGAKLRRYTPDFEVLLATGRSVLVEVKPTSSLAHQKVRYKMDRINVHFERVGECFVILTEQTLRLEPRQSNLRWLYHRTPRIPLTAVAIRLAVEQMRENFPAPLHEAVALLAPRSIDPYSALLAGFLHCPLVLPASLETVISLAKESDHAWFFVAQEFGF